MKYAIIVTRIVLGLVFAVFGSNPFINFSPIPEMQGLPGEFMDALIKSGYIYAIAALQVLGGLCLLAGSRFVPLGLTLLGPVIVNIVLYHVFLDRNGLSIAIIITALSLFLLWVYRYKFPAIFRP